MKLNGNLVLNSDGSGTIQNAFIESGEATPATVSAAGRLFYNTTDGAFYFSTGVNTWSQSAAGSVNTDTLQSEVDAIETASGGIFGADGSYGAAAVNALANVSGSANLLEALTDLDAAISAAAGVDTLPELTDVTIASQATGHILYADSETTWTNAAPGATSGVQAHDAGLDSIAGLTTAADTMIYTTASDTYSTTSLTAAGRALLDDADAAAQRVTMGVQIGVDVQAYDADLTTLAGLTHTGGEVIYSNGGTWAAADPGATSGVQAHDAGLDALAAKTTTGILVQTGADTFTSVTLAVDAGELTLASADGTGGNPTFGLASVANSGTGTFQKLTVDGFGRVTGTESVVAADITGLVDSTYVNVSGDTMTGNLNMNTTNTVTGLATPTADTDAATKAYVDALTAGLSWKNAVRAASTANGALATDFEAGDTLDGVTLVAGDRILLKDQTTASENGIYIVQATGAPVRATDMDDATEFDGAAVFVQEGTVNADSGYTQTATVTTVDTDTVTFSQFSGGAVYTWGNGLDSSGNTIFVNMGAGITALPSDEVGLHLYNYSSSALRFVTAGGADVASDATAASGDLLRLLLDGSTLTQAGTGLKVSSDGITAVELNSSVAGDGLTGGSGSALSVVYSTAGASNASIEAVSLASTANGLGASLVGIEDSGTLITATTVEGALAENRTAIDAIEDNTITSPNGSVSVAGTIGGDNQTVDVVFSTAGAANRSIEASALASTANGEGASMIGIEDAAANFTATTVEGVLTEIDGRLDTLEGATTALNDLTDAVVSGYTAGDVLVADGNDSYDQQTVQFTYEATGTAQTSYTLAHGLGQYVSVTVLDASTNEVIIPNSITMNSTNGGEAVITLSSALLIKAVVIGFGPAVTTQDF